MELKEALLQAGLVRLRAVLVTVLATVGGLIPLALTGSKSPLIYQPLPKDDPKMRKPDITIARNLLGWEPKVPLAEGLKKTIAYFKTKV
jgi:nucleoside-diphosphate-sugar epimerase